ncbi:MAG: hypothetical protein KDD22_07590 [Bdellovibrionales bacterium]|nr:hypothetical protein [Bdellovibrionales bacterium]
MALSPIVLASALVRLKEIPETNDRFILYSAFFREKAPRFGWQYKWVRFAISVWIASAVMFTTIGGNHTTAELKNPE